MGFHEMHLAFFLLYLILQISTNVASGQQCKPPEVSVFGKALKGHTFKKVVVTQSFECQRLCENERECLSFNFFISEKICELNNMTKEARPVHYVADQTRFYMGMWRIKELKSCKELHDVFRLRESQVITLNLESKPTSVLCHMGDFGCGAGGWTPVMKIDGNKNTFHYNSNLWSNKVDFNLAGGETGFDSHETKLPTYWNTPFSKICLGMKIGQNIRFVAITKHANSLHSLIADGQYRGTSLGREMWKTLIGSEASLQTNCNKEGFNVVGGAKSNSKARIGILANEQNDCHSPDSRIGFGTAGQPYDSNRCGNAASHGGDNGNRNIKGMGYILVM